MKNCSHTTDCETCASNAKMAKRLSNFVEQGFDRVLAQRDEAQQMVAELRGALADIADSEDKHSAPSTRLTWMQQRAQDALDRVRKLLGGAQ